METYEILKIINTIENKFDINSLTFDNIVVWPLIRTIIGNKRICFNQNECIKESVKKKKKDIGFINNHSNKFLHFHNKLSSKNKIIEKKDILFLADSIYRHEIINNKYFHKFADTLSFYSDNNLSILEYSTNQYMENIYSNSHRYITDLIHLTQLECSLEILKKDTLKVNEKSICNLDKLITFLEDENIFFIDTIRSINRKVNFIFKLKDNIKILIEQYSPKVIFLTRFWVDFEIAFILASKEMKIPVVDMQHGLITESHMHYLDWNKVPEDGYLFLPDYFWVWDDNTYNLLNKWCNNTKHSVINGSNIWLSYYIDNVFTKKVSKNKKKNSALFCVQVSPNCLPKNLIETIKQTKNDIKWKIRFHPSHPAMKKYISEAEIILKNLKIEGIDIEWENSSKMGFYELLNNVEFHLSLFSTTAYEAYEFGIQPIVISYDANKRIKKAIDDKMFLWITDSQELSNKLREETRPITKKHMMYKTKNQICDILNTLTEVK